MLAGFEKAWRLEAPTGPARGDVMFTARYSMVSGGSLQSGDAKVKAVVTPVPKKIRAKGNPRRRPARISRKVQAGLVKLRLGWHLLRKEKYRLKLAVARPDGSSGVGLVRTVRVR